MNRKRNVNYIKPEDPEFLKILKKQAGYDEKNHKFDELQNADEDFVDNDDSEQPQVVVLREGDLTAEEAEAEKKRLEEEESQTKADLNQRVIFKSKEKPESETRKRKQKSGSESSKRKNVQLLSFDVGDDEED